jgi:hypothetical protein
MLYLYTIKVFYSPTDAQLNRLKKMFKFTFKVNFNVIFKIVLRQFNCASVGN